MGVEVNTDELRRFVYDLRTAPIKVGGRISKVIERGAWNIKRAMQADLNVSRDAGIQHIARTISYDITVEDSLTGGTIVAEIGPDKPSGALANIAYFGTSRGGGHTRDPGEALKDEEPALVRELQKVLDESL